MKNRPFICIGFAIVLFFVNSCGIFQIGKAVPEVTRGSIDLRKWDFENDGSIKLNGEWLFYWNQLLTPEDFTNTIQPEIAISGKVPGLWSSYRIKGERLPHSGFATYRLIVHLPRKMECTAIKLMAISTATKVYINGKLITQVGTIGQSEDKTEPRIFPHITSFKTGETKLDIIVQVSNFMGTHGGIWDPISIGKHQDLNERRTINIAFDFFLFGSILIMGLYHIALYLSRKKDQAPVYFGLACISISIFSLLTGEIFISSMFPDLSINGFSKIHMLCGILGSLFFSKYFSLVFPLEFSKKAFLAIQIVFSAFALIVLVTDFSFNTNLLSALGVAYVIAGTYVLYCMLCAWNKGHSEARLFLIGFSVFILTLINDVAKMFDLVFTTGYTLVPFGLFLMVVFQAILLSRRFLYAYATVEKLSSELEEKNIELVKLDHIKDDFLSNTSHELRTPIHGIIAIAESIIQSSKGKLSEGVRSNLSLIMYSGRRLSRLISDILDFSRLRNNDLLLQLTPIDVKQLTDMVVSILVPLSNSKSLTVNNNISANLPLVLADENRVLQIMHNLIGNAIKFTEEGSIDIGAETNNNKLIISVKDTGIGIPENQQKAIFQSFKQVDTSIQRQYEGTGLGLSIAKRLIDLHGGTIDVESAPESGSTFSFTLPITSETTPANHQNIGENWRISAEYQLSLKPNIVSNEVQSTKRELVYNYILVVDDDPINLIIVMSLLSEKSFAAKQAGSGKEALDIIEKDGIPDLILLDVMMPMMSGFELCEMIREKHSTYELPIIFLTAKHQVADLEKAFQQGGNDYLTKPFSNGELVSRIQNQLQLKSAGKKLESLRCLAENLSHLKDSKEMISVVFNEIVSVLTIDAACLINMDEILESFSTQDNPMLKDFKSENPYKPLFALSIDEINLIKLQQTSDSIFKLLKNISTHPQEGSSWIFLQIDGFDEYLICLYKESTRTEFYPDEIEYLRNIVKEMKVVRSSLRKQALDVKTSKKYIDITKDLDKMIYIKGGGGGPYCTVSFDSEANQTETYRLSLQNLQNYFSEDILLRVHHSYLINPKHINFNEKPIVKTEGRTYKISMIDHSQNAFFLPVSKKYYQKLKTSMPKWFE